MKTRHTRLQLLLLLLLLAAGWGVSCAKFLDPLPDNRTELNSDDKIAKLLVSAYNASSYVLAAEWASDNADDLEHLSHASSRFSDELYAWQPSTEVLNNDGLDRLWSSSYQAIASANAALQAIEDLGQPSSLLPYRGEALMARAYHHFILVNMFAQHYSPEYSHHDLGVTYMLASETTLNPQYQRHSVEQVYQNIVADIDMALPLLNDASFASTNVAKFHFNTAAAYTFAARVHLFMGNWENALAYANRALGNNPAALLRNVNLIAAWSTNWTSASAEYNASRDQANFMISSPVSALGIAFGPYGGAGGQARYKYNWYLGYTEGAFAHPPYYIAPLGNFAGADLLYQVRIFRYDAASINCFCIPHAAYMFEFTDPVAQIGYSRGVYSPLTMEEALLTRAEALTHLGRYREALDDMQMWTDNTVVFSYTLTEQNIQEWASSLAYYTSMEPTPKKRLNPDFALSPGVAESMIHAILFMRRHQFLSLGLRWFDVKRYGIEITRRVVRGMEGVVAETDKLVLRDSRRAFQLPQDVIDAGMTPNP